VNVRTSTPLSIFIVHPSDVVTDHRPHGDGTIAWGFIRELARRGHRLHVACDDVDLSGLPPPGVVLHRLGVGMRREPWRRLEYMVRCRFLFERLRARERFDIVHQMNPVFPGLSLALLGSGVPLVLGAYVAAWDCWFDGNPYVEKPLQRHVKRTLLYLQQRSAAALLATTRAAVDTRIVATRASLRRVRWQNHGVDTRAFVSPEPAGRASDSARILFLANVSARKGIFPLLEAFALVRAARPDASLGIAGDGPTLAEVRARVTELGLDGAVDVLGNVPRADVPGLMHASAVYCLPSFGEPYATTVIEAMAAGLPLVVTNSGGLAELVDAEGGLLVPPRDVPALAAALLAILDSPERARRMGEHNRRRAQREFDWEAVVDTLESTYTSVCRATARARPSWA
jgi:glycosyltransferase involved in cell wall biosynthesis